MINETLKKYFTKYVDPESGVVSYILTNRLAPLQESFYFVNNGFSPSQRYMWFYAAYPPAKGRMLGVIDFEEETQNIFPETRFLEDSPLVVEEGAYWTSDQYICFRGPRKEDKTQLIAKYPDDLFGDKLLELMGTHLTLSPNKKELFFDAKSGDDFFAGTIDLETKKFTAWKHFDRCYKHSQFCPNDNNLVLLAQDHQIDPMTGIKTRYNNRLWLLNRDGDLYPVFKHDVIVTHEWWDADGEHFYALNQTDQMNGPAIMKFNKRTLNWENVVKGKFWHAKDYNHGQWFVADSHPWTDFYRCCPSRVEFIETATDKRVVIISKNPEIETKGAMYHIDPHPSFSPKGDIITHSTTIHGGVDVAITFVKDVFDKMV